MRLKHLITGTASAITLCAVAFGGTAFAQDAGQEPAKVGELIVTAQKREQRLQDVPIAVTVATAQLLADAGVKDIKDLTVLTPGLIVTSSSSEASTTARIRGIGTVGDNPGLESSVGVVVDGIYRPRNGTALTDLGELSRVEVLEGPQGTLFGKNATAGVINVVTAGPSFTPSSDVELTGGNFNDERVNASITGPLVDDKLAGRLYIGAESRDGFQSVVTNGGTRFKTDDGDRDFGTARGQLLWTPNNNFDAKFIADYTQRNENCCTAVPLVDGPFTGVVSALSGGAGIQNPVDPDNRVTFANRSTSQKTTDYGGSLEANWTTPWFGGAKLTSVTGIRSWHVDQGQDVDYTGLDILYRAPNSQNYTTFDQASEELRLSGDNGRFTWTVGGLVGNEKLISSQTLTIGTQLTSYLDTLLRQAALATTGNPLNPVTTGGLAYVLGGQPNFAVGGTQYDLHHQNDDSYAFFGNTDVRLGDQLTATFGLRYTDEQKTLNSHYTNVGGNGTCTPALLGSGATVRSNATGAAAGDLTQRLFVGYYCAAFNDPTFNNLTLNQKHDDSQVTGTAKLAWKPSDHVMAYASYARGFKAGGFNLDRERLNAGTPGSVSPLPNGALSPDGNTSFVAETVDSYEAGVKTTWFNGSLLLNAAGFYQEYHNFQLNAFDGIAFSVNSIPLVTTEGVDVDVLWQTPIRGLTTQGGLTYADTFYEDCIPGCTTPGNIFYNGGVGAVGALSRLNGGVMSFAPLWSMSAAVTYEHPIAGLLFRSNVSAKFTSKYNTGSDLNPQKENGEMTLVNARIGIGAPNDAWALELWAQNLFNHQYAQVDFDGTLQPNQIDAFLGAPRTFGLTLRFKPWGAKKS